MENPYITHPSNAQQARDFQAQQVPTSYSGGASLTPPSSEKDGQSQQKNGFVNGQQTGGVPQQAATPAQTPGAGAAGGAGVSGIVPTLQ